MRGVWQLMVGHGGSRSGTRFRTPRALLGVAALTHLDSHHRSWQRSRHRAFCGRDKCRGHSSVLRVGASASHSHPGWYGVCARFVAGGLAGVDRDGGRFPGQRARPLMTRVRCDAARIPQHGRKFCHPVFVLRLEASPWNSCEAPLRRGAQVGFNSGFRSHCLCQCAGAVARSPRHSFRGDRQMCGGAGARQASLDRRCAVC